MMHGAEVYKQQRTLGWSRIDLLIAIYASAIRDIDAALAAIEAKNEEVSRAKRHHAMRLVLQLHTGLDFEYGELPLKISQLCEFVQHALLTAEPERLRAAKRVLITLSEGFEGIRAEAIELEAQGTVPPLELATRQGVTA